MKEKSDENKYYPEIIILYVIATIFIMICHVIQWSRFTDIFSNYLHQIVASGVPLFLFISGFLSAQKDILFPSKWLFKKIKRVYIPYLLVFFVTLISYLLIDENSLSLKQVFILIFDLQGLQNFFIINFDFYQAPIGLGHLWFSSFILLCFIIISIGTKCKFDKKRWLIIWIIGMIFQPLLVYLHIELIYFLTFLAGFLVKKMMKEYTTKHFVIITLLMFVSVVVRFLMQNFFDNTTFYSYIIAPIQTSILGVWFFSLVYYIGYVAPDFTKRIATAKVIRLLSGFSYEIYLVHSILLAGAINVFSFFNNKIVANMVAFVLTLLFACFLKILSSWINKQLDRT